MVIVGRPYVQCKETFNINKIKMSWALLTYYLCLPKQFCET